MKLISSLCIGVLAVMSSGILTGCSQGESAPVSISTEQKVQDMVQARKIFDESNKDWNSLPADKQAEYTKLVGGKPEDATRWWDKMKNPSSGPAASGPSSSGPGTPGQ